MVNLEGQNGAAINEVMRISIGAFVGQRARLGLIGVALWSDRVAVWLGWGAVWLGWFAISPPYVSLQFLCHCNLSPVNEKGTEISEYLTDYEKIS